MGLLFFPRGGSAFVVRYLSPALTQAGWSVSLASGSLGARGEETNAATFSVPGGDNSDQPTRSSSPAVLSAVKSHDARVAS